MARMTPAKARVLLALMPSSSKKGTHPKALDIACWTGVKYCPAMVSPQKP